MKQCTKNGRLAFLTAMSLLSATSALAGSLHESLLTIESRWASAACETVGKQQRRALKTLLREVRHLHTSHSRSPAAAAWHGIVALSYLDSKGSYAASGLAKEARDALLAAESLDPLILEGRVYANLGLLYSKVSSRLGGFGDRTRGIGYLWKAVVVDPDGIDANYLYAEVLVDEKNYTAARDALLRASNAPLRAAHLAADRAQKTNVADLLAMVERKLQDSG